MTFCWNWAFAALARGNFFMHEVALMQDTLEMALDFARREGARKITTIALKIGRLSGVVPEALEFAFDVVTRATIAEGATCVIETVPVLCYCEACHKEWAPPEWGTPCPLCMESHYRLVQGRELELAYLEVN